MMKRPLFILLLILNSIISSAQNDKLVQQLFNNDKLVIEMRERKVMAYPDGGLPEWSEDFIVFHNKTNYDIQVNFEVVYRFPRFNATYGDFKRKVTAIIRPQRIGEWHVDDGNDVTNEADLVLRSHTKIMDFILIDYSVKKEEYEVPW